MAEEFRKKRAQAIKSKSLTLKKKPRYADDGEASESGVNKQIEVSCMTLYIYILYVLEYKLTIYYTEYFTLG